MVPTCWLQLRPFSKLSIFARSFMRGGWYPLPHATCLMLTGYSKPSRRGEFPNCGGKRKGRAPPRLWSERILNITRRRPDTLPAGGRNKLGDGLRRRRRRDRQVASISRSVTKGQGMQLSYADRGVTSRRR